MSLYLSNGPPEMMSRVLAVVRHLKWQHIAYLEALSAHVDLSIAVSGEAHTGAFRHLKDTGLPATNIGMPGQVNIVKLRTALASHEPRIVHVMYYFHEELTILLRQIVGPDVKVVFECRDPLSSLWAGAAVARADLLERAAIRASDGHIFVSRATREYLSKRHGLDLSGALIVPHGFSRDTIAMPSEKLSVRDQRVHMALVGTASAEWSAPLEWSGLNVSA
jgi:hypothetical protein